MDEEKHQCMIPLEVLIQRLEFPSLVFVGLTIVGLGAIVFYRARRSASGLLFVMLSLSFAAWAIVNYFSLNQVSTDSVLFWARAVLFSAAPQAMIFALLMHTFPSEKLRMPKGKVGLYFLLLIIQMGFALSPYVFSGIEWEGRKAVPMVSWGVGIYMAIMIYFFAQGIYWLVKKFIYAKKNEKRNLLIILYGFGSLIFFLLTFLLFAVVFFNNTTFLPVSPIFVLPFIISTGYTLVRQEFLHIRLVTTEFVAAFLTIILLTDALLSERLFQVIWKSAFGIGVGILGFLLIRSVYREIAQRKKLDSLTHSLEKANIRLKELDQQKTEFLSIASHQLRTPLSIIKGYIELIYDGAYGKPTKKLQTVLHNMDESNERLVKLVDEFLDITRIEQGRTKFSFESSDINELVAGVVGELKDRAKAAGITIHFANSNEIDNVYMDPEKIRHVVFNYVDNAIKYSGNGKDIEVNIEYENNGCTVRVKDHGLGFGTPDHASFFQKFYRGENVKGTNVNGTGLGIYVCRKFIEAHKGHVWAKSDGMGKGSEFGFWIPDKKQ